MATQEDKGIEIMRMLTKLKGKYLDDNGNDLFLGGPDSYIKPHNYVELARKFQFQLHESFPIDAPRVIEEVLHYLDQNRMVILAAWTKEKRIDLYLEPF